MDGLDLCEKCEAMNLAENQITEVDVPALELLANLKALNISSNLISEFPDVHTLKITDLNIAHNS